MKRRSLSCGASAAVSQDSSISRVRDRRWAITARRISSFVLNW